MSHVVSFFWAGLPLKSYISAGLTLTEHSPDCGVHATVIELFVVQLGKKREQDLDASYRVYGTVDGVGDDGLYILWAENSLTSGKWKMFT